MFRHFSCDLVIAQNTQQEGISCQEDVGTESLQSRLKLLSSYIMHTKPYSFSVVVYLRTSFMAPHPPLVVPLIGAHIKDLYNVFEWSKLLRSPNI